MIDILTQYTQFSSAMALLLFAVLQLAVKKKNFIHFCLAGFYLCLAYIIFNLWLLNTGVIIYCRYIIHIDTAIAFASGPLWYFYIRTVSGGEPLRGKIFLFNFLPAAAVFAVIIYHNVTDESILRIYRTVMPKSPDYPATKFTYYADIISNLHILAYVALSIINILPILKNKKNRAAKELKTILFCMLLVAIFISALVASSAVQSAIITTISINALTFIGILYFVFSFRYPDFTQIAIKEGKIIRQENTPIDIHNGDAVISRMNSLMQVNKVFTDETLTLNSMSGYLDVPTHQLSKIINEKLRVNFRGYINSFRISEAKILLVENPEMSVLEIAYKTGFNSKSSFNETFMKATGKTPRDFRSDPGKKPEKK